MAPSIGDAKNQLQAGRDYSAQELALLMAIGEDVDDALPAATAASENHEGMILSQRSLVAELGVAATLGGDVVKKVGDVAAAIGGIAAAFINTGGQSNDVHEKANSAHSSIASIPGPAEEIARRAALAEENASDATAKYNQAVGDDREPTPTSFGHQHSYEGLGPVTNNLAIYTDTLRDRAAEISAAAATQIRHHNEANVQVNALLADAAALLEKAKALRTTLIVNKSNAETLGAVAEELGPGFKHVPETLLYVRETTTDLAGQAEQVIRIATEVDGAL